MTDASKGLPVSHKPANHQLAWIRHWHEGQIEHQMYRKEYMRDQKQITRSEQIIMTIDHILTGKFLGL